MENQKSTNQNCSMAMSQSYGYSKPEIVSEQFFRLKNGKIGRIEELDNGWWEAAIGSIERKYSTAELFSIYLDTEDWKSFQSKKDAMEWLKEKELL